MSNVAAINFGTCWGTPNGQDLSSPAYMATGTLAVAEAVARRWGLNRGDDISDPNAGLNVMDLVNDNLTPGDLAYWQQQLAAEAEKDQRVKSITVSVTFAGGILTIAGQGKTAAGPFSLVLGISTLAANPQLLFTQITK